MDKHKGKGDDKRWKNNMKVWWWIKYIWDSIIEAIKEQREWEKNVERGTVP